MKKVVFLFLLVAVLLIEFTSATCSPRRFDWGPATAVENTDVTIAFMIDGDTCQGKVVNFSVKEYDKGQTDDAVSIQPASVTITSNSPKPGTWVYAGGTWRTEWQEDTDHAGETNPPEYYLTATLDGQTYTTREDPTYVFSNQYLNVTKQQVATCTDSDGGLNYYVSGRAYGQFSNGTNYSYNDTCVNSTRLTEWSCSSGVANSNTGNYCSLCANGACPIIDPVEEECDNFVEGEIIAGFDANVTRTAAENLIEDENLTYEDVYTNNNWTNPLLKALKVFVDDGEEQEWMDIFSNESIVNYTELNCVIAVSGNVRDQSFKSLNNTKNKLESLKNSIRTFPSKYQEDLEEAVGLIALQTEVNNLEDMYNKSTSDADYLEVIKAAMDLDIPSKFTTPKAAENFVFFSQERNIDLALIQSIGTGSYETGDEEKYVNAIIRWNQEKIEAIIDFKEINALYPDGERPVLMTFDISVQEKEDVESDYFFVVENLENIKFGGSYEQGQSGGSYYITLGDNLRIISFTTTENVDFITLPAFISPSLDELEVSQPEPPPRDRISKWWVYLIVLIFIGVFGSVMYVALQRWYESKYEDYLFKNKNHLFNLVTYINNSRAQGIKDEEVSSRLKKSGWDGEQVRYGMRKYVGKNTGMPRIPLLSGGREAKKMPVPSPAPRPMGEPPRRIPRRFR